MNHDHIHKTLVGSLKLSMSGHYDEALRLMDDLMAQAVVENEELWFFTFARHAALLGGSLDRQLLKGYYEKYLNSHPENPRALYGLADTAMEDGQPDIARQFARHCYQALLQSSDERAKKDLLDLVLERWPDVGP